MTDTEKIVQIERLFKSESPVETLPVLIAAVLFPDVVMRVVTKAEDTHV